MTRRFFFALGMTLGAAVPWLFLHPAWAADALQTPGAESPPAAPSLTVQENITYASVAGQDLHLDIYEPAGAVSTPRAAVVLGQ